MNAIAMPHSIPTLSRLLAIALAKAAWTALKTTTRVSLRVGDATLIFVGALTLMLYYYTMAGLLFLHEYLTSMDAMRRYKRWIVGTVNFIDHHTTIFGEWAMNAIFLRGSLGQISFNVEDDCADGQVIVREFGDARNVPFNFFCENRYLMRHGIHGRNIAEIRTRAMDHGFNINRIIIDGKVMTTYAKIPDIQLPEVMSWKPAAELPNPKRFAPVDILTRVA